MTKTRRALLALALALAAAGPAAAQMTLAGETFAASVTVAGAPLVLNGVGLRAVAWIKGYAAGLYLAAKATTPAQVQAVAGAKRLQMRMMQDVSADEFVKAVNVGIERNTPPADRAALDDRRAEFARQVHEVGAVKKGDVVDLDFVPQRGLVFTLNGKARGEPIPGADFYSAVLRIFIGDKPVDQRLKAGLLGGAGS